MPGGGAILSACVLNTPWAITGTPHSKCINLWGPSTRRHSKFQSVTIRQLLLVGMHLFPIANIVTTSKALVTSSDALVSSS